MNPRTRRVKVRPCVLCGYPFSDVHHVVPRATIGPPVYAECVLVLCPNHHRLANLVQAWTISGVAEAEIRAFAGQHFDADFTAKLLPALLLVRPETFEQDVFDEMLFGRSGALSTGGLAMEVAV